MEKHKLGKRLDNLIIALCCLVYLICHSTRCVRCSSSSDKLVSSSPNADGTQKRFLYVGTYTKDIYVFELVQHAMGFNSGNITNGSSNNIVQVWTLKGTVETIGNPSFLVANAAGDRLYAVNELVEGEGAVSAFLVDHRETAAADHLTLLNKQRSGGHGPTHLAIDPSGRNLLVANYGTGNLVVFRLGLDGAIGDRVHSVESNRPNARAHQVVFDQIHGYTLAVFLGLDEIRFYQLNENSGDLRPMEVSRRDGQPNRRLIARVPSGSGPRHLAYGKNGRHFYVVNELNSTVSVFSSGFPMSDGSFRLIQHLTCLPDGVDKQRSSSYAGGIAIHPTGKYVYVTNRGHDSVAAFAVNVDDGTLRPIQFVQSGGFYPRHILLDSSGRTAFVSNQNGFGGVQLFHVDPLSGHLTPRENLVVPKAICVLLLPR